MSVEYRHMPGRGDAIAIRSGGPDDPRPGLPMLTIGDVHIVLTIGQLAVIRDAADRWLAGDGFGDDSSGIGDRDSGFGKDPGPVSPDPRSPRPDPRSSEEG
jgi:hypothetical protein